jgi:hypothetical protein
MEKQPSRKKKKNKIWPILVQLFIGGVIGLICGIFIINKLFTNEWDTKTIFLSVIFVFVGVFININIHEFGHFIFGKIHGYSLVSYRISFLTWSNENGKMKFSVINNKGYSGLCAMLPPEKELAGYKNALFYGGGIIFNIISGMIFLILPFMLSSFSDTVRLFFLITGGIALLLGVVNFIPFISGNNPTDGKILWSLILKKPFAKKLIELNKMASQLASGLRPRDIQINCIENIDNLQVYDILTVLYSYFKALDSKDLKNMLHYADVLEKNIDSFPSPALPALYYELCFIGCITKDVYRAEKYFNKGGKILQNDKDINGLRVKAYYEYHINKNKELALAYCKGGLGVADKFPIKGQGLMESDLIKDLKETISVTV